MDNFRRRGSAGKKEYVFNVSSNTLTTTAASTTKSITVTSLYGEDAQPYTFNYTGNIQYVNKTNSGITVKLNPNYDTSNSAVSTVVLILDGSGEELTVTFTQQRDKESSTGHVIMATYELIDCSSARIRVYFNSENPDDGNTIFVGNVSYTDSRGYEYAKYVSGNTVRTSDSITRNCVSSYGNTYNYGSSYNEYRVYNINTYSFAGDNISVYLCEPYTDTGMAIKTNGTITREFDKSTNTWTVTLKESGVGKTFRWSSIPDKQSYEDYGQEITE